MDPLLAGLVWVASVAWVSVAWVSVVWAVTEAVAEAEALVSVAVWSVVAAWVAGLLQVWQERRAWLGSLGLAWRENMDF